jgi:hypothetical protein
LSIIVATVAAIVTAIVAAIVAAIVVDTVAGIIASIPQAMDIIQPNNSLSELDVKFPFVYHTIRK